MRILLSNDDGLRACGLRALYHALKARGHDVRASAPATEQSGVACGVTAMRPLFADLVKEGDFEGYAVHGTPADSVMLGLGALYADVSFDLVVSGINRGPNAGTDVLFSGTVGAATQGALAGLPALAVSDANFRGDSREQAEHAADFASRIDWAGLPRGRVYNLNYPNCPIKEVKGIRICPQSAAHAGVGAFEQRKDPYGRPYWWMGNFLAHFNEDTVTGSDKTLLREGYITLTPLRFDLTDDGVMEHLRFLED